MFKLRYTLRNLQLISCSSIKFINNSRNFSNTIQINIENKEKTVKSVYNKWLKKFNLIKLDEAKESIENIIAHCLKSNMPYLTYNQLEIVLNNDTITEIDKLCELRLKRMPIQYIIGEWPFRDLNLKIKPPVFIPRPETEELVELVLKSIEPISKTDLKIADICCGSGAISLALLKANNKISVIAVDRSNEACDLTKLNAQLNHIDNKRLEVLQSEINESNLLENINQTFDIIVSNPPYIPQTEISQLQPEILLYEDIKALDGGLNGFETIKLIITMSSNKLVTNGLLFLEIDPRHPQLIEDFLKKNTLLGLELSQIYKDFCSKNRFVKIIKK